MTWTQPSHPGLISVSRRSGRSSSATSLVALPAGAHFAKIPTATFPKSRTWTTVQYRGDGSSIELNSDLVFCNHSCNPTLVFDMDRHEVRVADHRPLKVGDELTFFYPSTEWVMVGPFVCKCSEHSCGRWIAGAKFADADLLRRNWLNRYIRELLATERSEDGFE